MMGEAPNFVGSNELKLNNVTMRDIVQFWLEHRWAGDPPQVASVTWRDDSVGGWYVVKLDEPEEKV